MERQLIQIENKIEYFFRIHFGSFLSKIVRRLALFPRYWLQYFLSGWQYKKHGEQVQQNILFIAGLPKSGTTWIESMLSSYSGFINVYLPEIFLYELVNRNSHTFNLYENTFWRLRNNLAVIKTHIPASMNNLELLNSENIRYLVVYRDLRDVAVSYFFFVSTRPWHPEYKYYHGLSISDGLKMFAEKSLQDYATWIKQWRKNRDFTLSLEVRYEDLLENPHKVFNEIVKHFYLQNDAKKIDETLKRFLFSNRNSIEASRKQSVHFRKGIKGDWKNYFDDEINQIYKQEIAELLIELGYERNSQW